MYTYMCVYIYIYIYTHIHATSTALCFASLANFDEFQHRCLKQLVVTAAVASRI